MTHKSESIEQDVAVVREYMQEARVQMGPLTYEEALAVAQAAITNRLSYDVYQLVGELDMDEVLCLLRRMTPR